MTLELRKRIIDLSDAGPILGGEQIPVWQGDALTGLARKLTFDVLYAKVLALLAPALPDGVATLDGDGKLLAAQLPDLSITDTFVVASEAEMLALAAQTGDVAVRTDVTKSFILAASPATVLANWKELLAPTSPVLSVAGLTGAIAAAALRTALSLVNVSTDHAASRFDGTTGAIQNSGVIIDDSNNVATPGGVVSSSPSAGIGYSAGAGGAVTQITSKSTAVTLNKITGNITTSGAALAADAEVSFTLNNSSIAATDAVIAHRVGGASGAYLVQAVDTGAGTCVISLRNMTAGSLSQAIDIRFTVIKGASA